MNSTIRGLKGVVVLAAVAGLGLLLRWATADSIDAATSHDLTSMASLAIGAVAWIAYGWLTLALLVTVLEQTPGTIGRAASAIATRITSQTTRVLLRSALGAAAITPLTLTPTHATAVTTQPASTTHSPPTHSADDSGDWRGTEVPSSVRLTEKPKPKPTGRTAVPEKSPGGRVVVPDRPTSGAPTRYTHLQSGQLARPGSRVVKFGDSLWSIAAAELGPTATAEAIAARWPHWYAANRQLIGPDPNRIHPGQVLTAPKEK